MATRRHANLAVHRRSAARPVVVGATTRTSQVPGGPPCLRAPLFDPGGAIRARPLQRGRAVFRCLQSVDPHKDGSFRGSITRPTGSLSTLDLTVTRFGPRLASSWWPTFAGRACYPLGPSRYFTAASLTADSKRPGFPGARRLDPYLLRYSSSTRERLTSSRTSKKNPLSINRLLAMLIHN